MVGHNPPIPERYLKARRKAVESLYCGVMTVYEHVPEENPATGITDNEPLVKTLEGVPCRLCLQSTSPATENEPARADRGMRVMLAPEVDLPAGAVIEIEQHGKTARYTRAGRSKDYYDHQTVPLVLERELT